MLLFMAAGGISCAVFVPSLRTLFECREVEGPMYEWPKTTDFLIDGAALGPPKVQLALELENGTSVRLCSREFELLDRASGERNASLLRHSLWLEVASRATAPVRRTLEASNQCTPPFAFDYTSPYGYVMQNSAKSLAIAYFDDGELHFAEIHTDPLSLGGQPAIERLNMGPFLVQRFSAHIDEPRFRITRLWLDAANWHVEITVLDTHMQLVLARNGARKWVDAGRGRKRGAGKGPEKTSEVSGQADGRLGR